MLQLSKKSPDFSTVETGNNLLLDPHCICNQTLISRPTEAKELWIFPLNGHLRKSYKLAVKIQTSHTLL